MPFKEMAGYPKVVPLTHKLAAEFAAMTAAKGDREEREWRKDEVVRCVKEGSFRAPEWASAVCKEDGVEYRVNGKHTSKALAELNGSMPRLRVLLTRFECDTLRDVAELYNTFDKNTSARSPRDNVRSFQMTDDELSGLSTRSVSLAVSGMAYEKWGLVYHPQDERSALMFANKPFCEFVHDICAPAPGRPLRRAGVVAAMFKTFNRSQTASKEFWSAVRDGAGHPASVPDRKLREWLLSVTTGSGRGSAKRSAGMHEFMVICLRAWNAWRKGKPFTPRYGPNDKTPGAE